MPVDDAAEVVGRIKSRQLSDISTSYADNVRNTRKKDDASRDACHRCLGRYRRQDVGDGELFRRRWTEKAERVAAGHMLKDMMPTGRRA